MSYSLVWFKRDLRVFDHAPLFHAARQGPVLCLYILEPELWSQPDYALQHFNFLRESLRDLAVALRQRGARLELAIGSVPGILARVHAAAPFHTLVSHEETGNAVTFRRDLEVARWCRAAGVRWQEWPQHGVVRRLASRDLWQSNWEAHIAAAQHPAPSAITARPLPWPGERWPDGERFGLAADEPPHRQRGGRSAATSVLEDFLEQRSRHYRGGISSPLAAPTACSRLSPYLALGCLSMRETVHATRTRIAALDDTGESRQRLGLHAFLSRLHWHCHFIQKLESEPAIEFRNMHRGYDGLREDEWNEAHFAALTAGRTGWPMVDACVAMLRETGWLNFRMRAMLVSVAAYPLWLHWRPVGLWLARQFLDYEPGIHWSQMQMQAGTTGINTTRIYNPVKQAQDHDPDGRFVRHWLPVLRRVPDSWLFEPWRMPAEVQARCGVRVGEDWPIPPVDLAAATRIGKARIHALRALPEVRATRADIVDKHGSRQPAKHRRDKPGKAPDQQLTLIF